MSLVGIYPGRASIGVCIILIEIGEGLVIFLCSKIGNSGEEGGGGVG